MGSTYVVIYSVEKRIYYNLRSVRENEDKICTGYEKTLNYSMSEMNNMLGKAIFYKTDHNYDHIMEDAYERNCNKNITNESLNESENEICIYILKRNRDSGYYYFYYDNDDNEEFGCCIFRYGVFKC